MTLRACGDIYTIKKVVNMKGNMWLQQILNYTKQDFYEKTHLSPKIKSKTCPKTDKYINLNAAAGPDISFLLLGC